VFLWPWNDLSADAGNHGETKMSGVGGGVSYKPNKVVGDGIAFIPKTDTRLDSFECALIYITIASIHTTTVAPCSG
jgi:hypothetical protein